MFIHRRRNSSGPAISACPINICYHLVIDDIARSSCVGGWPLVSKQTLHATYRESWRLFFFFFERSRERTPGKCYQPWSRDVIPLSLESRRLFSQRATPFRWPSQDRRKSISWFEILSYRVRLCVGGTVGHWAAENESAKGWSCVIRERFRLESRSGSRHSSRKHGLFLQFLFKRALYSRFCSLW